MRFEYTENKFSYTENIFLAYLPFYVLFIQLIIDVTLFIEMIQLRN
jgi:hypothetical protein